jgi:hypothetical protein
VRTFCGRYIQLPINAGMLEAVRKPWQVIHDDSGRNRSVTLLEAAAELGVGVFASGPLSEGSLLSNQLMKVGTIRHWTQDRV